MTCQGQTQVLYPIERMRFSYGSFGFTHTLLDILLTFNSHFRADFVYMVPPFIAYFGALQGGDTELSLLQAAYDQCRLYRDELRDDGGLWRHIALGSWQDNTHWGTGMNAMCSHHHPLIEPSHQATHGLQQACSVCFKH